MVIVIGGTGLVGSHLLCNLAQEEEQIVATFQRSHKIEQVRQVFMHYFPDNGNVLFGKIQWECCAVNDVYTLGELINEGDTVYHCAALVSFHRRDFDRLMKINREGTANVVNACLDKKAKILGYISSTAAIGGEQGKTTTEKDKWKKTPTISAYSISKHGAEKEVFRGIEEGLKVALVNPCVILGAGNWKESSLTILGQVNKGLSFYPSGANATVDARDVANVIHRLVKEEILGERFLLIGSNQNFRILFTEMANQMKKKAPSLKAGSFLLNTAWILSSVGAFIFGKRSPITKETLVSAQGTKVYSAEKIEKKLNYTFYTLEESIDNAIKGRVK
jgi:dihydroflavonol-4-reductase